MLNTTHTFLFSKRSVKLLSGVNCMIMFPLMLQCECHALYIINNIKLFLKDVLF